MHVRVCLDNAPGEDRGEPRLEVDLVLPEQHTLAPLGLCARVSVRFCIAFLCNWLCVVRTVSVPVCVCVYMCALCLCVSVRTLALAGADDCVATHYEEAIHRCTEIVINRSDEVTDRPNVLALVVRTERRVESIVRNT